MVKLFDRNSTRLTISEFYDNFQQKKYRFDVEYQRKSGVWEGDKKSFLIDTIMKNYPIPPIFMRPSVDNQSGKTVYDIVDGKQRLEAIIGFIEGDIPLTDYFWEDSIFIEGAGNVEKDISGKLFDNIKADKRFNDFVKQFWTYSINIDYLYEENKTLISNIFDRLNRNGEPLKHQELRNAKYHSSELLQKIRALSGHSYWVSRFGRLKNERMEDEEFVSELFFLVAENKFFDSSPQDLDALYEAYSQKSESEVDEIASRFNNITTFIESLKIDYDNLKKLSWTTHLYGLFSFAWFCTQNNINSNVIRDKLLELYSEYFGNKSANYPDTLSAYKASCSSRTRSKDQREKRLSAIKAYCGIG